jgi:hypothetical protein
MSTLSSLRTEKRETEATPTLRNATFEDYSGISALHDRHGFATKSHEEWISLWSQNPLYNQLYDWPIGWILEGKNHAIVGYLGNIPLPYVFRSRPILAATSRAWIVDPPFRSYSFLLLSRFFQQRNVDLFINNTVNKNAVRGYEAFRVCRVPVGAWDESIFWITNYRGFAASLLASKEILAPTVVGYLLSLALLTQDKLARKRLRVHREGGLISFANCFDPRFDTFWDHLQCSNPDILLATRSREILEWHFRRPLAESRAWVVTAGKGPELAAYAIFLRRDNRKVGLNRLRLIDFQSLDNRNELLIPILALALERCRKEGIHMLETIGLSLANQRVLDSAVLHRRSLPSWSYFYKTNDGELAKALEDPRAWDPSSFDGDASL